MTDKIINTDWYRDTLAAGIGASMPKAADSVRLMADTIDTLQETIESLVEQRIPTPACDCPIYSTAPLAHMPICAIRRHFLSTQGN